MSSSDKTPLSCGSRSFVRAMIEARFPARFTSVVKAWRVSCNEHACGDVLFQALKRLVYSVMINHSNGQPIVLLNLGST